MRKHHNFHKNDDLCEANSKEALCTELSPSLTILTLCRLEPVDIQMDLTAFQIQSIERQWHFLILCSQIAVFSTVLIEFKVKEYSPGSIGSIQREEREGEAIREKLQHVQGPERPKSHLEVIIGCCH